MFAREREEMTTTDGTSRSGVFISYSHKDADWLKKLQTMMSPLIRNNTVAVWWDGKIKPSQKWREEIDKALASAKVGVLLVSPDFLASNFINDNELPYLLGAAERHAVKLIWVLLRNCLYDKTAIASYQAAHDVSKPLNSLRGARLDAALVAICKAIEEAANP
jgi:internalin A